MGKRTAQKDTTIDTTSDSRVNSNFPNKWSPASLIFNNYFYLFLYLYITWISTNNNAPHLKLPKNQKQKSRLGTASNKNYWGASTSFRSKPNSLTLANTPLPSPTPEKKDFFSDLDYFEKKKTITYSSQTQPLPSHPPEFFLLDLDSL